MPTNFQTLMQRLLMLKQMGGSTPTGSTPVQAAPGPVGQDIQLPQEGSIDPRLAGVLSPEMLLKLKAQQGIR